MRPLGSLSKARHVVVGASIAATTALAALGIIGSGGPERFDAKLIVVQPAGSNALRITEYVDQDFGGHDRHGYERVVPNDFGVPEDVVASSPDAPDQVNVVDLGGSTRIRIGDPDVTVSGQHRYVLTYTLPEAGLDVWGLELDLVAPEGAGWPGDPETGRFEVAVTGMLLSNITCDTGPKGAEGGCTLERQAGSEPPVYRAVMEPLPENHGLSIFADVDGIIAPADIAAPPIPDRRPDRRLVITLAMIPLGLAGAVPVYRWARRSGRNEVFSGGAADAAFGEMPAPQLAGERGAPPATTWVADDDLADLATIEFVPPKGIAPWQARVLLTERLDDSTVAAWFSGLAGREAITLGGAGSAMTIASGPKRGELAPDDAALLASVLELGDPYTTGKYDPMFAGAWRAVASHQRASIKASGWWRKVAPGGTGSPAVSNLGVIIVVFVLLLVFAGSVVSAVLGLFAWWPAALALGVGLPALVACGVYRALLPARSARGSALALRTESFRRFLAASEGQHVEWAWTHGVLREYSGWAVALDEADAWSAALAKANVPEPARAAAMSPILVSSMGSSIASSRTAPSSSGSGGGSSSFSGGGSGGGGGGGSSGSW